MRAAIGLVLVLACTNGGRVDRATAKVPNAGGVRQMAPTRASTDVAPASPDHATSGPSSRIEELNSADAPKPGSSSSDAPPSAELETSSVGAAGGDSDLSEILHRESLGPLHWGITETQLRKVLGTPTRRDEPFVEGATGMYVSNWHYPWAGVELVMAADKKTGPWSARMLTVTKSNRFATAAGIRVGSARTAVEQRYHRSPESTNDDPDQFLVGSVYGGLLFIFDGGVVTSISIGPFAF